MSIVRLQKTFAVSIDIVWKSLTDKAEMSKWYFTIPDFNGEIGAVFEWYEDSHQKAYLHRGKIVNVQAPILLEHTWSYPLQSNGESLLRWDLKKINETQTEVTLTHSGLENFSDARPSIPYSQWALGWKIILWSALKNHLHGLVCLKFQVIVEAPAHKLWEGLWKDENYRYWTSVFTEGSHYQTDSFTEGNTLFLMDKNGDGMYSTLEILIPSTLLLIRHLGELKNKIMQPLSKHHEKWTDALEIYHLEQQGESTLLSVRVDTDPLWVNIMNKSFPLALQKLKSLVESDLLR